jgi:hypothetical protein
VFFDIFREKIVEERFALFFTFAPFFKEGSSVKYYYILSQTKREVKLRQPLSKLRVFHKGIIPLSLRCPSFCEAKTKGEKRENFYFISSMAP